MSPEELVEKNIRLVGYFIRKYFPRVPFEYDDLFQIGCVALWKAALNYNPEIAKFTTFAGTHIYRGILQHCQRTNKKSIQAMSLETEIDENIKLADCVQDQTVSVEGYCSARLDFLESLKCLTDKQTKILALTANGYTQTEIGNAVGVTQVQVSRTLNKARAILKNAMEVEINEAL